MAIVHNHTVSNRILIATLDKNWRRQRLSGGSVVYIATANKATIELLVRGVKKNNKKRVHEGCEDISSRWDIPLSTPYTTVKNGLLGSNYQEVHGNPQDT